MIHSMKRLWKDRRGNVLAIAGAAIPLVVGSAGLATDTIQWVTWKRELQRAADSAAFAGVFAKAQGASTADAAVTRDVSKHNNTGITLTTSPVIAYPTATGWTHAVRVTLSVQKRLGFSSLFISSAPTITATGTAALVEDGDFCVVALEDSTTPGITIQGSAEVRMGCGMISNSKSASVAVDVIGNGHSVTAEPVAGVGGVEDVNGVSNEQSYHVPQDDPYKDRYPTDIPGSQTCTPFGHASKTASDGRKKPGCYTSWGNGSASLEPGVYYLENTTIDMQGNDVLSGTGVTIIFTGDDPGHIELNGNSKVILTAPTDTTCATINLINTCDYKNMLMIQSEDADLGNESLINGNNGMVVDGAIYFPRGKINFTGSSGPATKCAMIVARRVDFGGSTNVQNDTSGCNANTKVKRKTVKLVA